MMATQTRVSPQRSEDKGSPSSPVQGNEPCNQPGASHAEYEAQEITGASSAPSPTDAIQQPNRPTSPEDAPRIRRTRWPGEHSGPVRLFCFGCGCGWVGVPAVSYSPARLSGAVPLALGGLASGFGMGAGRCLPRYDHRHDPPTHDHTPTVRPGGLRAPPGACVPLGVAWSHGSGCLCLLKHCAVITPHPATTTTGWWRAGWWPAGGGSRTRPGPLGGAVLRAGCGWSWTVQRTPAPTRWGLSRPNGAPPNNKGVCVCVVAWMPACSLPPAPCGRLLPCPLFLACARPHLRPGRAGVGSCCVRLLLVPVSSSSRLTPPGAACFHIWPINPVVYWEPSTPPNSRGACGDLILESVSRLDAFSGYPART